MPQEGEISDWNEANLKMLRLHEAQERINFCKRNPKAMMDGKFNYEWWFADVDVMYGEGKAKYNDKEIHECERLKVIGEAFLRCYPPHDRIFYNNMSGTQAGYSINDERYMKLIQVIQEFEDKVKYYNDKHGLSTKNRGVGGLF